MNLERDDERRLSEEGRLCSTPAVDPEYLVSLTTRLTNFSQQKKSRMTTGLIMQQEMKKRQQEAREGRNARLGAIKMQHRHVIDMVAVYFNVDYKIVEEGVVDFDHHIALIESLTVEGGRRALVFLYQELPAPPIESGRGIPENAPPFKRVIVSDGSDMPCLDRAVVVYRIKGNINIEQRNVCDEMMYATLEVDPEDINTVSAMQGLLGRTSSRALEVFTQWGELNKTAAGQAAKKEFLDDYRAFDNFITATKSDLDGKVKFIFPEEIYRNFLSSPEDVKIAARNPDIAAEVHAYGKLWVKQIEKVLVEAEQIRRERDDIGPMAELEYWRKWLTIFTSVVEFIKTDKLKMCLQCMRWSRSKIFPLWAPLDNRVTEACNEAADNVKYLYALERFSEPLYRCDPTTMGDHISSLMYTIRMIYATSRYYNTSERVTALLVKVTNQMVTSCRLYLTENNTKTVWEYKKKEIIAKMTVCLNLYKKYKLCFAETQRQINENPEEKPFGCSESNIFVKFESFRLRLERLIDTLNTYLTYLILQSSRLEGIEVYVRKFNKYYNDIATKPYDALDHRKPYFDADYENFKQQVNNWEAELRNYLGDMIALMPNVTEALRTLARFDKIGLPCFLINRKYLELLDKFYDEIGDLRDRYNEERQVCQVPRNMPPVSGRIFWIRQLYKRLEGPMEIFKTKKPVIDHPRAQKVIKLYNCICKVFVQYELVHHQLWCENVSQVEQCLSIPILSKHPRKNTIAVNFDNYIEEVIREVEYMWKLGLKVPDTAAIVCFNKERLYGDREKIKALVLEYVRIRRSIPRLFFPLMKPLLYDLELAFNPGMSQITWVSMEIAAFCDDVHAKLFRVGVFIKELSDMKAARIDEPLLAISKTMFLDMPNDEALSPHDFLESNVALRMSLEREIETKMTVIEEAAIEIIDRFVDTFDVPSVEEEKYFWMDPSKLLKPSSSAMNLALPDDMAFRPVEKITVDDLPQFKAECMDMFAFFFQRSIDALVRSTKASLEALRKRACAFTVVTEEESTLIKPLMFTNMTLQIPNISISPNLDEIQFYFGKVISNILEIHKGIIQWGQRSDKLSAFAEEGDLDDDNEGSAEDEDAKEDEGEESTEEGTIQDSEGVPRATQSRSKLKNYYRLIADHKEVVRNVMSMQGAMLLLKPDVMKCTEGYLRYSFLWAEDREHQIRAFVESEPIYQEIKEKFTEFVGNIDEVTRLPERHVIGALEVKMGELRMVNSRNKKNCPKTVSRYQIALVAIVLLLLVQDGLCYKQKNEHKKTKGSKYKNKVSAEVKNHNHNQKNHQQHQHHYRPTRSVEEEKYKVEAEETAEEKIPYVVDRPRKGGRMVEETINEYETSCPRRSPKSCSVRQESGLAEKKKKKSCYVMVEEEEGAGEIPVERTKTKKHQLRQEIDSSSAVSAKKTKNMKKKQSYVLVEEEPEIAPEDIEYKVIVNKKAKRKVMPTYIYVDEVGEEGALTEDSTFSGKSLKKKSANYIIEGMDENELENRTGRRYVLEEMLDHSADEEGNGLDEEEENETI